MLDSLSSQKMFEAAFSRPIFNKNNKHKFAEDSVPVYGDNVYEARLAKLDAASPCDLVFNSHVKSFIELYTIRKRESVSRMLGMAMFAYALGFVVLSAAGTPSRSPPTRSSPFLCTSPRRNPAADRMPA